MPRPQVLLIIGALAVAGCASSASHGLAPPVTTQSVAWCPSLEESPPVYDTTMVDSIPRILPHQRGPTYPPDLQMGGRGGSVWFTVVVDSTGIVERNKTTVLSSTSPAFTDAALRWIGRVRFSPGWRAGRRVRVCLVTEMRFEVL